MPAPSTRAAFRIDNMDCPTEEALIRQSLSKMVGIVALDFNLMQRKLTVTHTFEHTEVIVQALRVIDMHAVPFSKAHAQAPATAGCAHDHVHGHSHTHTHGHDHTPAATPFLSFMSNKHWLLAGGMVAAILAEAIAFASGNDHSWPVMLLALLAIASSGGSTYKKGWIALKNLNLNINALMAIAVTGAVVIGQWPEAAMVMVLFSLAEMIEAMTLERARNAISGLMALTPQRAIVRQGEGNSNGGGEGSDDNWQEVDADTVLVGSMVRVLPGARIALDGEVCKGESFVNQAAISGESMPVAKTVGDKVFAGTLNESGSFEYRVTALQLDSTLARIIHAVEEAQAGRAPIQRFVDSFAKIYTPVVFLLALLVMLVPPLLLGLPWLVWTYKALVLLVIACPCALVVSTPVTVVSALAAAAKAGILIKGGAYLEQGCKIRALAFDKTGTLTLGQPVLADVEVLGGERQRSLLLAASLASHSDHPVSKAISAAWQKQATPPALLAPSGFAALAGLGVKGQIDGRWHYLGNHRLLESLHLCTPQAQAALKKMEAEGQTAVIVFDEQQPLAVIGVADAIRPASREAMQQLQQMGIHTLMLTGDNELTAKAIAATVGITDVRANLMPQDKLAAVAAAQTRFGAVGMVGDGINDAPALARADIGFAMGLMGTDTALETADVALMDDDLRKIAQFIRLSRATRSILKQNIALALGIKLAFLTLAVLGMATLWMAVFADMGASLLVVFNGLRLTRRLK
jgi:Cd2+/Zn2+-exporting ATPase